MKIGQFKVSYSDGNLVLQTESGDELAIQPVTQESIDSLKTIIKGLSQDFASNTAKVEPEEPAFDEAQEEALPGEVTEDLETSDDLDLSEFMPPDSSLDKSQQSREDTTLEETQDEPDGDYPLNMEVPKTSDLILKRYLKSME